MNQPNGPSIVVGAQELFPKISSAYYSILLFPNKLDVPINIFFQTKTEVIYYSRLLQFTTSEGSR